MKEILYDWGGANVWLFHAINDLRAGWLDTFMQAGTFLGDHSRFPLYAALLALFALFRATRAGGCERALRWLTVLAVFCLAYVVDGLLVGVLKEAFDFPRPLLALPPESVHVIGAPKYRYSLPSGHATFAMTVAASLWPVLARPYRFAAGGFVLWVALSRVSVGAHFPADVLAGCLLALATVLAVRAAVRYTATLPGHR